MKDHIFKAFVVSEQPQGVFKHGVVWRKHSDLPVNEVYVKPELINRKSVRAKLLIP
ncbi:MAG TPA: hypothetical protein VLH16_07700 [Bacteroidales bacterium]|nr:hypothetical protein [Bacteroidales bacterium]